jgi:calcineurin-like phosphoesterase
MRILLIGDLIAQPGLEAVIRILPRLRQEHNFDFVVANGENMAHGLGWPSCITASKLSRASSGSGIRDTKQRACCQSFRSYPH